MVTDHIYSQQIQWIHRGYNRGIYQNKTFWNVVDNELEQLCKNTVRYRYAWVNLIFFIVRNQFWWMFYHPVQKIQSMYYWKRWAMVQQKIIIALDLWEIHYHTSRQGLYETMYGTPWCNLGITKISWGEVVWWGMDRRQGLNSSAQELVTIFCTIFKLESKPCLMLIY